MLASGDNVAGSRQFLNHLQKKKRAEKDSPATLSAAEVLKQQKQLLGTKACILYNFLFVDYLGCTMGLEFFWCGNILYLVASLANS